MPHNNELRTTPESLEEQEGSDNEQKAESIDADATRLPDGAVQINANFVDANNESNVIHLILRKDGQKELLLNGVQPEDSGEAAAKVGELLGVDLSGNVDPDQLHIESDSPLAQSLGQERDEVKQSVRRELQGEGADISDESIIERRTDSLSSDNKGALPETEGKTSDQLKKEAQDAALAETVLRHNGELVKALANKQREAGNVNDANRLEQDAFEVGQRTGGVEDIKNDDNVIRDFIPRLRRAMSETDTTVEDLKKSADEESTEEEKRKAA